MKTFTLRSSLVIAATLFFFIIASSQNDSLVKRSPADSSKQKLNMDAIYSRPFLTATKLPVAIGGYLETNTQFVSYGGSSQGFSFQMRRMTLFVSSSIARKMKFLSELELEEGTKEINLEYCAMDVELHPLLNLRGGIIMNPIGGFNQNHDGPRWDFIDRPILATNIIPSTLSNVGMGLHGKYFSHHWIVGYELYLTNGFNDKVINNEEGRTSLHAGKEDPDKFTQSNSGLPMYTGKMAIRNRNLGELGLSCMRGVYNKFQKEGKIIDQRRNVTVLALDYNTSLLKNKITVTGEYARVMVDVPDAFTPQYGNLQWGAYTDVIVTVLQKKIFGWEKAKVNIGVRTEMTDYNVGKFRESGGNISDDVWAIVPSLAFRPSGTAVIRLNYRFVRAHDFSNNPAFNTSVIQFGFSSYF